MDDDALRSAAGVGPGFVGDKNAGLRFWHGSTRSAEPGRRSTWAAKQLAERVPIWFIYPKGRGQELTETEVRSTALAAGIVDTKVCAVSPTLTGLRFVRRRVE